MIISDTISSVTSGTGTAVVAFTMILPLNFGATQSDPQISVSYTYGTPFLSGTCVVIPLSAKISAKYVNEKGIVYRQQEFNEDFVTGYPYTAVPTSVAVAGNQMTQTLRKTRCCKSYELLIQGSVNVTVA